MRDTLRDCLMALLVVLVVLGVLLLRWEWDVLRRVIGA
jgi:hypothetical protein